MSTIIKALFQMSSWPMRTPVPYSGFHLVFGGAGILAAIFLAWKLSRSTHPQVLPACGLILAVSEIYKQGFLYHIVNGGQYDWWYFPFQLCSIPMYLCLLLPFMKPRMSCRCVKAVHTFLQDFALLGGVMALAEPSGLMHPYLVLTLHGFIWHFILIFIGLYCAFAGLGGQSLSEFADQCGIPSLWKCRYVLHQPILPQWAGCLSSDCPDHRDGSRQHTVSFIGCAGRFSVPCHAQAYPKAVLRQAHNVFNNCFPSTVGNESSCMVQGRAEPCR